MASWSPSSLILTVRGDRRSLRDERAKQSVEKIEKRRSEKGRTLMAGSRRPLPLRTLRASVFLCSALAPWEVGVEASKKSGRGSPGFDQMARHGVELVEASC